MGYRESAPGIGAILVLFRSLDRVLEEIQLSFSSRCRASNALPDPITKWVLCGKDHVIEHTLYRVLDCKTAHFVPCVPNSRQALLQEIDELGDVVRGLHLRSPTRGADRPVNYVIETCFGEVAFDRHGRKMNDEIHSIYSSKISQSFPDKIGRPEWIDKGNVQPMVRDKEENPKDLGVAVAGNNVNAGLMPNSALLQSVDVVRLEFAENNTGKRCPGVVERNERTTFDQFRAGLVACEPRTREQVNKRGPSRAMRGYVARSGTAGGIKVAPQVVVLVSCPCANALKGQPVVCNSRIAVAVPAPVNGFAMRVSLTRAPVYSSIHPASRGRASGDRQFIPGFPLKFAPCCLFSGAAPLLEKEGYLGRTAGVSDLRDPAWVHETRSRT